MPESLSLADARAIAIAAAGFSGNRPARVTRREITRVIRQLGLVQLDFVNVLIPAHYLVLFSRLGAYDRRIFHDTVYRSGRFIEHWAHEASIVPIEHYPLLRYRRDTHRARPYDFEDFIQANPAYIQHALDSVRDRGPLTSEDLPDPDGVERNIPDDWFSTIPRAALEVHFGRGDLAIANRRENFARVYDLTERVIAEQHRQHVDTDAAHRQLLATAARALGVATAADLADYYRMLLKTARPRIEELVESGDLQPVKVEGWRETAYLSRGAANPRKPQASALLSPFDPLVWFRPRLKRLFDFEYSLEIYLPKHKRKWGYYVLPFLLNDRLVARVDLKADRAQGSLVVAAAHAEPNCGHVAPELSNALRELANWLALPNIKVEPRTRFARALAGTC